MLVKEQIKDNNFLKNGTIDIIDLIMPECFKMQDDYIYLGPNQYVRVYAINVLPRCMEIGFLNEIFELGSVEISTYIENIPDGEVIGRLTEKYSKIKSNINLKAKRGEIINYAEDLAAKDLDSLREVIQTNKERMFYAQILVSIWDKSIEELEDKCDMFNDICARKSLKPRAICFEQDKALISSLPIENVKVMDDFKNITTGALACLIPVGNSDLSHPEGMYLGKTAFTNSPVFYDNFIGPPVCTNPHMAIFGMAGAGKSVTLKLITERGAAIGEWVIVLDPEEEYKKLIENLGGQYIVLKAGEKSGINPFDLDIEDDGKDGKYVDIYAKQSEIREMLSTFCEKFRGTPLQGQEITELEEVINYLYKDKNGITKDPQSLYEENVHKVDTKFYTSKIKKKMPTLSDLVEELEKREYTKNLAATIKIMTGDRSLSMFDNQTAIDLDNKVIGIDLKHLSDEFTKFFAMVNILSWIWSKLGNWKYKNIKKRVIVDEGWIFAKYEHAATYLEHISRRGRKYRISLVIASQQIDEFLVSNSGKTIINQCATKLIMKQDPSVAKEVTSFFRLSSACDSMISSFTSGQGLLMTEQDLIALRIQPFKFEWPYVTT